LGESPSKRVFINLEIGTERGDEIGRPANREVDHHVDVVGRTRLSLQRAGKAPAHEVSAPRLLDRCADAHGNRDRVRR